MELRFLYTEAERELFQRGLAEARATRGAGFREKKRSREGQVHMAFGRLYGVFDEDSSNSNRILAGFVMHSLEEFSQSYPKPDLTHLPPGAVFEAGELWSLSKGAGMFARRGCAILLGLLHAQALLVYPIVKPWDLTGVYTEFRALESPVEWPYAETLSGEKLWVQPMVLDGDDLRRVVSGAWRAGFETQDGHRRLRFNNPIIRRPAVFEVPSDEQNGAGIST